VKYTILVDELSEGKIEVEANSSEEAMEKAKAAYYRQEVKWVDTRPNFYKE
jgi:hypothetical protein